MKSGVRALGVAESYHTERSTLAGAVVRADRVVDGFAFDSCTVGGTDATTTILSLVERIDRADIPFLFVSGIAPAWYNVIDLKELRSKTDLGVISISFEESDGLEPAIRDAFDRTERDRRIERYRSQPDRRPLTVNDETVFVRSLGVENPREVVRAFTPDGGRPEPLRVAREAARAADVLRGEWD